MKNMENIQVQSLYCETGLLVYRAEDTYTKRGMDFSIHLSKHAVKRTSQRGIESYKLAIVLEHGEVFMKQGLIYYVLGENNIPNQYRGMSSCLKNIVVVCNGQTGDVITGYRSSRPFSKIKHKSKRLYVKSIQATIPKYRRVA